MKKLITILMLVTIGLASCTKEEIEPQVIDLRQKYYFKLYNEGQVNDYILMINNIEIENHNNDFVAYSGDNVKMIRTNNGWWMLHIGKEDWDVTVFPWPDDITTLTSGMVNNTIIFDEILE
jgi:hypothetical protein